MRTKSVAVACWVEPGFELLELACIIQILSLAGSQWNWRPFRIALYSAKGGLVLSSAQTEVNTLLPDLVNEPELVLVTAGRRIHQAEELQEVSDALRKFRQPERPHLTWVGLGRGVHHLVREGICSGSTVAAPHPERSRLAGYGFDIRFTDAPWHRDRQVISCATSDTLPVGFHLVESFFGVSAARSVKTELGWTGSSISLTWPNDIRLPKT